MRRWLGLFIFLAFAALPAYADLVAENSAERLVLQPDSQIRIVVQKDPWDLRIYKRSGALLTRHSQEGGAYGPGHFQIGDAWYRLGSVESVETSDTVRQVVVHCTTTSTLKATVTLRFFEQAAYTSALDPFSPSPRPNPAMPAEGYFTVTLSTSAPERLRALGDAFAVFPDEPLYGGGQRFNAVNQRGQVIPLWINHPSETEEWIAAGLENTTNETLAPFILSPRGYGIFLNTPARGEINLASPEQNDQAWSFYVTGSELQYFFFYGEHPYDIIRTFMGRVGMPPMPPKWFFSIMKWRDEVAGTADLLEDANKMREYGLPCGAIWVDNPWEGSSATGGICAGQLAFHPGRFPDPQGMIDALHDMDFKFAVWVSPFMGTCSTHWQDATSNGYLVRNITSGEKEHVDFTSEAARDWWAGILQDLIDQGVDGVKADRGEEDLGAVAAFADGHPNWYNHNLYAPYYSQAIVKAFREKKGDDFMLVARGAYTGSQRLLTAVWAADQLAAAGDPLGMRAAVRAGQTAGLSGYPFWGSDVGGYTGFDPVLGVQMPTKATFLRWAQFGAVCPLMEVGGNGPHEPWRFDDETIEIYRKYALLHMELFPYFYSYAKMAHEDGLPILRALGIAFPDDREAPAQDQEFLVGDHILAHPVAEDWASDLPVIHYFPQGTWKDYWGKYSYDGPQTRYLVANLSEMPLFVRAGALFPVNFRDPAFFSDAEQWKPDELERPDRFGVRYFPQGVSHFTVYDGTKLDGEDRRSDKGELLFSYSGAPRLLTMIIEAVPPETVYLDGVELPQRPAAEFKTEENGWRVLLEEQRIYLKFRAGVSSHLSVRYSVVPTSPPARLAAAGWKIEGDGQAGIFAVAVPGDDPLTSVELGYEGQSLGISLTPASPGVWEVQGLDISALLPGYILGELFPSRNGQEGHAWPYLTVSD